MSEQAPRDPAPERKCLAPTFVRDGAADEGKYRNCELRQGHAGNHSTTYAGKRHDWAPDPAPELARTLAALDRGVACDRTHDGDKAMNHAARLLREMREDFEWYAMHRPSCSGQAVECPCGLSAARKKWELPS